MHTQETLSFSLSRSLLISTRTQRFFVMEKPLLSPAQEESLLFLYNVTRQYAAVDITMAKVIAAEVIVCYLGMLCKCKTLALAQLSVF